MARHEGGEQVQITLIALKSEVAPWTRLKGGLKAFLRVWGWRCVNIRGLPTANATPPASPGATSASPVDSWPPGKKTP